jgi:allantoate deiminase
VHCSLDVRHVEDALRASAVEAMFDEARAVARRRGVRAVTAQYHQQAAVRLDPSIVALAEQAAAHAGQETLRMTSGAGHDAMVIAPHVASAMVFLRSPDGISHHPDETVLEQDVAAAVHMGLHFLDEFTTYLSQKETHHRA